MRAPPPVTAETLQAGVSYAITSRRSIRGFLPRPVERGVVEKLIEIASRAPSGSNTQPWKVHVLTGTTLQRVIRALSDAFSSGRPEEREYDYYPVRWRSPYIERRREVGWALYRLAGVAKGDREAGDRQRGLNYSFFGAPVALVFTIDKDLEKGSWLDYGMFLENIMVAARGFGLDTCAQAAIANYPSILRDLLGISADEMVVCGMALGFADPDEPTNALDAPREALDGFVTFHSDETIA